MPSIRYINQSAPFWDFVSSLEDQGTSHPFFSHVPGHPFGDLPHHGRHARAGPSNQAQQSGADEKKDVNMNEDSDSDTTRAQTPGKEAEKPTNDDENKCEDKCGEDGNNPGYRGGCRRSRRFRHAGGPCGGRRGGPPPFGHRGGWWAGGFPPHHGGMPGAFPGAGGPFNPLSFLNAFLGGNDSANEAKSGTQEFRPDADVFDTESAYVIHVSLPGAQKEDVGVNWDADKSELSVAGVVYRPGVDEELLKSLALDERRVGVFERKIRLGTPANPAQVEVDAITAKMENGVLVVEVPKLDRDYVDVKKVDVL